MEAVYLIKIGEITLKGENRGFFERTLKNNIKRRLKGMHSRLTHHAGRFYLRIPEERSDYAESVLARTFGIVAFFRTLELPKDIQAVEAALPALCDEILAGRTGRSFKIEARRADKGFPLTSYDLANRLGQFIRDRYPEVRVDVHDPDWIINVEVRDQVYVYGPGRRGPGGLPVGCAGRGVLLLSGGIDSPVAGYLMAKRGLRLESVYFHAYPYTSDQAREKVERLAESLAGYAVDVDLHVVPFTEIQLRIRERAKEGETTLLMRACMMEIASRLAERVEAGCLVTGEALSQVASQTLESIRFTELHAGVPVFRPLVGMDKEEIIRLARTIGTYETSILPYDDCCAIFSPKHPLTKPNLARIQAAYEGLEVEPLLTEALERAERVTKTSRPAPAADETRATGESRL